MFDSEILALAVTVNERLVDRGWMLATAESCTGGLIAGAITAVPGSSTALHGGFVTYANRAKIEMVGVPAALIASHGAVSEPVARAMAEGTLIHARVDIAIAVTGIAGPAGGTPEKPVGLVHFGVALPNRTLHHVEHFGDLGRDHIRRETVRVALGLVRNAISL